MRDIKNFLFLIAVYLMVTGNIILFFLHFTSCQLKQDPLSGAKFPCEMMYKGWNYECNIQCQDSLYNGLYKNYYKAYHKGDIISKPLQK